jgi:hypothetical protein
VNLGLAGIAVWILTGDKKVADDVFNIVIYGKTIIRMLLG